MLDLTICAVVDDRTIEQLRGVVPTWRLYKPWLFELPWLVVCDLKSGNLPDWQQRLHWLRVPRVTFRPWVFREDLPQRERMLTAWVREVPLHIKTRYWAKIDTDTIATGNHPWPEPEWFNGYPAIIAPPWSYTKPKPPGDDWGAMLNQWASNCDLFDGTEPLDLPPLGEDNKIHHPRVCGWCMLIQTNFAFRFAQYVMNMPRLPVPSQDTFHWYCAERLGAGVMKVKMKRHGWDNVHRDRLRVQKIKSILEKDEPCCG
jgi:hypothetical protein